MLPQVNPINSPHPPPAFGLARAKARPSPLMGSVLRAGKARGFIFWLLSSGPMSCPSQQSEKYSTWTPQPRSLVRPQHCQPCSTAPSHPGAQRRQRLTRASPTESPREGRGGQRRRRDQMTLGPSSSMFFYLPGRGRHILRSFNRGSFT